MQLTCMAMDTSLFGQLIITQFEQTHKVTNCLEYWFCVWSLNFGHSMAVVMVLATTRIAVVFAPYACVLSI